MFYKTQTQTEKPYKKSQSKTLLGVLLVLVAVAVYVLLLKPFSDGLAKKEVDLSTKNAEVASLNTAIDSLKKQEAEFQLTEDKKNNILKVVPIGLNQDQVIRDVVEVAAKEGISLRSISFSKSALKDKNVNVLRVSAGFDGVYDDLINFLKDVEGNERRFKINSINVQLNPSDLSLSKRVSFSLTMDSFYQD